MCRIKSLSWVTFLWATLLWCGRAQRLRSTSAAAPLENDPNTHQVVVTDTKTGHHRGLKDKTNQQRKAEDTGDEPDNQNAGNPNNNGPPPPKEAPPQIRGDRRTVDNLVMNFQLAKARLLERLRNDYGAEYFDALFMDKHPDNKDEQTTIGRNAFLYGSETSPKAWARTVRKMKINLLQYLIEDKVQDFVWATAGNDAAAGHGNFFDEQYTMVLQDRARDLFQSVGLDLVARPFGMGGTTSAPEIAGCLKEIYGTDVDLITWDYAMTDGRNYWRMEFFAHRVEILQNHPTLLVLNSGTEPQRRELVDHLTNQGMSVLRQDAKYMVEKSLLFPDTRFREPEELEAMPEHVRHFRCGYGFENGKGCMEYKFRHNGTCDERPHQTNWHKGWKWHAYYGNTFALFLMEVMEDALDELNSEPGEMVEIYKRLEAEEDEEYRAFEERADVKYEMQWAIEDLSAIQFYRDPTFCHTARLPAQTRYLGHVFDKERYDTWFSYKKGFNFNTLQKRPEHEIKLSYMPDGRETKQLCNLTLSIDSKDFFLANGRFNGYQKIVVPNDAEQRAYDYHQSSGIIVMCARACSSECAGSQLLSVDHVHTGKANMKVNGEPVGSVEKFDNCFILRKETGRLHWESNHEQRYEIEVHVDSGGKHFEFTSIIVW